MGIRFPGRVLTEVQGFVQKRKEKKNTSGQRKKQ